MAKILKKLLLWLTSITAILLFICFTAIAIFYHSCVVAPQKRIEKTQETPYDFINSIKITDDEIIIDEVPSFVKSAAAEALQHYIHQKMPDGFLKRITRPKKKQVGESSSNSISKDKKQARINLLTLSQLRSIAIHKDYIQHLSFRP